MKIIQRHAPSMSGSMPMWVTACVTLLACVWTPMQAQPSSMHYGQRFIVAFPDTVRSYAPSTVNPTPPAADNVQIIFFSNDTARVTVRANWNFPPYERQLTVLPTASVTLDLTEPARRAPQMFIDQMSTAMRVSFTVTSDRPISLYCYYMTGSGSEAFTPLPVESWGSDYYAMGLPSSRVYKVTGDEYLTSVDAPAQIMVIAAEDNTEVNVVGTDDIHGGRNRTVTLNAGDAYLMQSRPEATFSRMKDLSATRIYSNKPIGVLSGNTRSSARLVVRDLLPTGNGIMNSLAEWLVPTTAYGRTFVYEQVVPIAAPHSGIIRVYSGGLFSTVQSSVTGFTTTGARRWAEIPQTGPLSQSITTSAPTQAMMVIGAYVQQVDSANLETPGYLWSAAMVELVPRERWGVIGRFRAPTYPSFLRHWVQIVADADAEIYLDGSPVTLAQVPNSAYRHVVLETSAGDHSILATRGRFTAFAYGSSRGFEAYTPLATRKEESGQLMMHPAKYSEVISIAYAYPIVGRDRPVLDSLIITRVDSCDSTVAIARLEGQSRLPGDYDARLDPASQNTQAEITPSLASGLLTGFRIRFTPRDPGLDAQGTVVITSRDGRRWEIPYLYRALSLVLTPDPVELLNAPVNEDQTLTVMVKNIAGEDVQVRSIRLRRRIPELTLVGLGPLPRVIVKDDSLAVSITFRGSKTDTLYTDTLIVETTCRTYTVPVIVRTTPIEPKPIPLLSGHDWRERWLTTSSACTKSGVDRYDTVIVVRNAGSIPFKVRSIELIGSDADAGFFQLDSSDATTTVRPGDSVGSNGRIYQRVVFRPDAERSYSATVRLITEDGEIVTATLEGIGIESHVTITPDPYAFGATVFEGAGRTVVPGAVVLRAPPTRRLTVQELRIVSPNGVFTFDPAGGFIPPVLSDQATWWVLDTGETRTIPLLFVPLRPDTVTATIEAIGDHSLCDDSVATLTGAAYLPIDIGGFALVTCGDTTGVVSVVNRGSKALSVTRIELEGAGGGAFTILPITLPATLEPDGVLEIPVRFSAGASGASTAAVAVEISSADGTTPITMIAAPISVVPVALAGSAHIERSFRAYPGQRTTIPILLDSPLDGGAIDEIEITLEYAAGMTQVASDIVAGTLLEGWTVTVIDATPGRRTVRLRAPAGRTLTGIGTLMSFEFLTYVGNVAESEITFRIEPVGRPCIAIAESPGHLSLDSICGLDFRLIELSAVKYALDPNRPNPFNPTTGITFSIGLDADTRLEVIDASGRRVATLVDGWLKSGRYSVTWDARGEPSGLYYYRLVSGDWSRTERMLLVK